MTFKKKKLRERKRIWVVAKGRACGNKPWHTLI
jgi:hypothetical protein